MERFLQEIKVLYLQNILLFEKEMVEFEIIENNYSLSLHKELVDVIDGYTHIIMAPTNVGNIFIKEINGDDKYIFFLEKIYKELSEKTILNSPLLTKNGRYICDSENNKFIVFTEADKTKEVPPPSWWAFVLYEIHSISINENIGYFIPDKFFSINHNLFLKAMQYVPKDIKEILGNMLQLIKCTAKKKIIKVVNHGDPLRSNVMKKNGRFILIDFENACIKPKEYDLQRHLWDFAVNSSRNQIGNYYRDFIDEYLAYENIDFELLHDYYILDFCKTLCWLYVVCNDNSRSDLKRQKNELEKFVVAMRTKKISEMLDCMRW